MSPYITLILLSAVTALLMALAVFSRWSKAAAVLCLLWLAASLPLMYFCGFSDRQMLLFFLVSSAIALLFLFGGEKKA